MDFKSLQLFGSYNHNFADEILISSCYRRFPKVEELMGQPQDLWFGYYHYSMDLVCNEILTHSNKMMMIVGRIFPEEENLLQVVLDLVSPCKDSLPPACTQIFKEIKT